jgi:hypothetical protein
MKITATQKEFLKRMGWIVGVMGAYDPLAKPGIFT